MKQPLKRNDAPRGEQPSPELRRELRTRLGDGLRDLYEPTLRAPLPSEMLRQLDELAKAARSEPKLGASDPVPGPRRRPPR